MKVLVTGATGMVGAELTRQLLTEGADVRILRRESSDLALLGSAASAVEHTVGDVTDPDAVAEAMEGIAHVYHCAAFVGMGPGVDRQALDGVNVGGTANVVNAALSRGVSRLVHTSSMAAFGRSEPAEIIDERTTWHASRNNTAYARSKYLAELEVLRGVAEGLDAVMVNPALVFGHARPGENTREIAEKIKAGKLPGIPSGGTAVVDARDVATGLRLAMLDGKSGERYFLGAENISWKSIIETLATAIGVAPPARHVNPSLAMAIAVASEAFAFVTRTNPLVSRETVRIANRTYRYSNRKAVQELGWKHRTFAETASYVAESLT